MNTIEGSSKLAQSIMELIKNYENEVYEKGFNDGKEFESDMKSVPFNKPNNKPKSANQQRAELIEKAKKFVEERQNIHHHTNFVFVNKGRKITCLVKGNHSGKILRIGRSKCNPNDVFNLYIGQAISLARALKIDVPAEFLKATQPDKVVVGMTIQNEKDFMEAASGPIRIGELFIVVESENPPKDGECQTNSGIANSATITDDTNAQYGELDA